MPRPRHDSEVLPAKERLENAFWELLADRDYRKITVTDVVREAGVNRNSFYYHFSSLPELADSAILHQVESIPINRTPRSERQSRGTMARPRHRHALRSRAASAPRPPGPVGRPAQHA
ncbi:transcriptional regulator [Bifidobacterium longum subsp. longum]|nr:transcriptional regulator [Bifidobacterium longum subsp. longum]